jgi:hypothetical protein
MNHPKWIQWLDQILFTLFIKTEQDSSFQNGHNRTHAFRYHSCLWLFNQWMYKNYWKKEQMKKVSPFENHSPYFKLRRRSNQTANSRSTRCSLQRNMQWHIYIGHFRWVIQSERKLAAATFFHPSSWMITFDEWTVYTVHFQWFIQSEQCKPALTYMVERCRQGFGGETWGWETTWNAVA